MAVVFPDIGKEVALQILLDAGRNPEVKLFKNNFTPGDASVLGDFTEADFDGYAAVSLAGLSAAAIDGSDRGYRSQAGIAFVKSAGVTSNTVYGWYLVLDNLTPAAELFMAEKFPAPQVMGSAGDTVTFDLTIFDELGA